MHHKEGSVTCTHTCTLAVSNGATSKPKRMLRNDVCYSAHCVFLAFCRCVLMCVRVPHSPSLYASLSTQILLSPVSLESEAALGTRGIPVLSPYVVRSSSCLVLFVPAYLPVSILPLLVSFDTPFAAPPAQTPYPAFPSLLSYLLSPEAPAHLFPLTETQSTGGFIDQRGRHLMKLKR